MILQKINFEKIKMQTLLTAHTSWSACNRVDIFYTFPGYQSKTIYVFCKKNESRFWSKISMNFN